MPLPADAPDTWAKLTQRGTYHFVPKGERTTSCGIPAQQAVSGWKAEDVDRLREFDRPNRCAPCLRAARKVGHK